MSDLPRSNTRRLSLSEKYSRLRLRLRNPEWRKYGGALLAGKGIGIALVLVVMAAVSIFVGGHAFAADPDLKGNDEWLIRSTPRGRSLRRSWCSACKSGLSMLGLVSAGLRETVNVLVECVVDTCLCGILFYAVGFAFMFAHGNGFIGYHWFFLQNAPATYETTGVAFLAVWIFQFAFADTCSTITSGAMIGRTGFVGDLLYSICVTGFIYPVIGHWAWGPDGWLANMGSDGHFWPASGMGFHDFAGSTVVHTIGGMIALAGAIVLGPRLGRTFKRDGGAPMLPHDLTIAVSGGLILWFGWYGFNPGSTLSAMDFVRDRSRGHEYHTGSLCSRAHLHHLRLHDDQKVGRGLHHERVPCRTRGHYLPLLLGHSPQALFWSAGFAGVIGQPWSRHCWNI